MEVTGIEPVTPWTLYSTCNLTATENKSPNDTYRENYRNVVYNYIGTAPKKTGNIQQNGSDINHSKQNLEVRSEIYVTRAFSSNPFQFENHNQV